MIDIAEPDFEDEQLVMFLQEHLDDIAPTAPVESQHALDLSSLQGPGGLLHG